MQLSLKDKQKLAGLLKYYTPAEIAAALRDIHPVLTAFMTTPATILADYIKKIGYGIFKELN